MNTGSRSRHLGGALGVQSVWIPPKTREKLQLPAAPGGRHSQIGQVVMSLLGSGLIPESVFAQVRAMYPAEKTDKEIRDWIAWAAAKNPQPCGYRLPRHTSGGQRNIQSLAQPVNSNSATAAAETWLAGFRCDETDLWDASPWRPPEDPRADARMLLAALYDRDEQINIVTDYEIKRTDTGAEKAAPRGAGKTLSRDEWMLELRSNGLPASRAGGWMRMNPVLAHGSGKAGAITDADVTAFRFLLLESDKLSLELQLSMLARLPLPIAAIIFSGGASYHAWVNVDCCDGETYRNTALRVLGALERFGFDQSNKNPSRLSRLAGAQRTIGAQGGGIQRLIYLNPEPTAAPVFGRTA